ncbi:hypothetical protein ANRL4_01483 [Anaerolineae bacterium]|nr:hypothetical protein ANRL4_01483 [Anaerolineae bacterium]
MTQRSLLVNTPIMRRKRAGLIRLALVAITSRIWLLISSLMSVFQNVLGLLLHLLTKLIYFITRRARRRVMLILSSARGCGRVLYALLVLLKSGGVN